MLLSKSCMLRIIKPYIAPDVPYNTTIIYRFLDSPVSHHVLSYTLLRYKEYTLKMFVLILLLPIIGSMNANNCSPRYYEIIRTG